MGYIVPQIHRVIQCGYEYVQFCYDAVEMAAKYSAPLKELALATRDSVSKKKKKNIVGVIIEVC